MENILTLLAIGLACLLVVRYIQVIKLINKYMGKINKRCMSISINFNSKNGNELFSKRITFNF